LRVFGKRSFVCFFRMKFSRSQRVVHGVVPPGVVPANVAEVEANKARKTIRVKASGRY
jgi:hypothetical protein